MLSFEIIAVDASWLKLAQVPVCPSRSGHGGRAGRSSNGEVNDIRSCPLVSEFRTVGPNFIFPDK